MLRVLFLIAAFLLGPKLNADDKKVKIREVPATAVNPASGEQMFKSYCSPCHGLKAKGDGPAAPALKAMPADLTLLAKENGGKFPDLKVFNLIAGDSVTSVHGSKEMPVWGDVFRSISRDEGQRQMRLHNLTKYVESIQAK